VDVTVVVGAGTALVGALLGSLGAPLLQGRLADRTSLRNERMVLYAEAMLHVHFVSDQLQWLVDPYGTPGTTATEIKQREEIRRVPDQTTSRVRLVAHKRVRDAWLELLSAEEGLRFAVEQDEPGFRQPGSDPMAALAADYPPVVRLREAVEDFERVCRAALRVTDCPPAADVSVSAAWASAGCAREARTSMQGKMPELRRPCVGCGWAMRPSGILDAATLGETLRLAAVPKIRLRQPAQRRQAGGLGRTPRVTCVSPQAAMALRSRTNRRIHPDRPPRTWRGDLADPCTGRTSGERDLVELRISSPLIKRCTACTDWAVSTLGTLK
jgi:hypothetical protein